jgi:allantoinase
MAVPLPTGYGPALYQYSPIIRRPSLAWPGSCRVALVVTLYLEYWQPAGVGEGLRDPRLHGPLGAVSPDYLTLTRREYGNRIGVFRVLEVLGSHGLPVTVALSSGAAKRYPRVVDACLERGYEFAAHGGQAGELLHENMSEGEELAVIREAVAAVTAAADRPPTGWISQDYGESTRTPRLLAKEGLDWVMDWSNDDQPYWMATQPRLVSLPNHSQWDDVQLLELGRLPIARYPALIREALGTLWREGRGSGRVFQLGVHPWVLGEPHLIRYLAEALAGIVSHRGVWAATAGEVARWFAETVGETTGTGTPR